MEERKSLYDISWKVDEPTYRADPALSYSKISRYQKVGFNGLDHIDDKIESPSLTFGSAVDSIITGGQKEFEERFIVADYPDTPDSVIKIVKSLFNQFSDTATSLDEIKDSDIILETEVQEYQKNWKPATRAKVIKEKGSEYYNILYIAEDKTVLNNDMYADVMNAVDALKTSPATKFYFEDDNPFDDDIERLYQLKFKGTIDDVPYRCMADEIVVDYKNKTIQPVDLKTSSYKEWDFFKAFVDWHYQLQARLYWLLIKKTVEKDDFFKDFKVLDYKFIVVNKETLTPLVWDCPFTQSIGTLTFGKNNQIEFRHPCDLGKELYGYIQQGEQAKVPNGVDRFKSNNLTTWLNTL